MYISCCLKISKRILNPIILSKRFSDFSGVRQKARCVARALQNLEQFRIDIDDDNDGKYVGALTWINFLHSIPNLKTLQISRFYDDDDVWKELHGQLFRKNSLPHLEHLTLIVHWTWRDVWILKCLCRYPRNLERWI